MAVPLNILIVEDSPNDAALLVAELQSAGFDPKWRRVQTEPDFRAGLAERPDIVFSDFTLPQFSVRRALEVLHENEFDIPFIVVSGTIGEERAVESMKAGATDYVLKDRPARLGPSVHRALREAKERSERLRAEEQLRLITETSNEVFWRADADLSAMFYVSPGYERVWGRSIEHLRQNPRAFLEAIHPEDRGRVLYDLARETKGGPFAHEYRIIRPDGSIRWIWDRGFPVRRDGGPVTEFVGVAQDITERKQLEAQFRQAQKMESIGQLAGGVAHDFNNLLTVIQGHASLLLSDPSVSGDTGESAEQISLAAERAAGLTRQLLTFSRRQVIQSHPLNLNDVIAGVIQMLRRVLGEDITLHFEAASLPPILADAGMLEQILMNLAINARDAMPKGGALKIRTGVETVDETFAQKNPEASAGPFVWLTVSDTGSGIPPENLSKIFEPFFTTKEIGKGTGLGLATVYGIVKQHHGWITLESELSKGTTFKIYFPATEGQAETSSRSAPEEKIRGGNETILLVEDEVPVRRLVRNILEARGYRVIEADSGQPALEEWQRHHGHVDLLLTDLVMPGGMNGRELAEALHAQNPKLKIIFMSGYGAEVVGKDFHLREGTNFLQKPFPPRALAACVRDCLDSSQT